MGDLVDRLDILTAGYQAGQISASDYGPAAEALEREIAARRERLPLYRG
jgi:hypothetical protein